MILITSTKQRHLYKNHLREINYENYQYCCCCYGSFNSVIWRVRGGTDGAQLSFMGLPCPNLFTGGYNYHGKHEFVTLEGMEKAVKVIVRIAELTAARKGH